MAKQLGLTAVSLSSIENDKVDITISRLIQIPELLEVTPATLLSPEPTQYFVFNNCTLHNGVNNNYNQLPEEIIQVVIEKLRNNSNP
jgi:transcriptional regulator with XRE-family HTH domain